MTKLNVQYVNSTFNLCIGDTAVTVTRIITRNAIITTVITFCKSCYNNF